MPTNDETHPEIEPDPTALEATVVRSTSATTAGPVVVPGYDLMPEIARGGMGVVYRAHDTSLDREVAVKVMLPNMDAAAFVREARIASRLPHPGIPPVYALGALPDGRPFLAMKLIRGDTLDRVLKARADLAADRGQLLAAFEQMCHAVGYAHAQGIVHRDLKPANVMVGSFGEVQVMDWGLAKEILATESGADESDAAHAQDVETSIPGQAKGTPAYMAPEQARGEPVDARADVFALGGILAAILTGKPPFAGDNVLDTIHRATRADLGDTFARLDACGADAELRVLAKRCLAVHPADRPADGAELAAAVAQYRAAVEERLRRAERDRAASEAKAEEHRKRRQVQFALAAAVVLLVGSGAGFAWWRDKQAAEHELADERAAAERLRLDGARQAAEARAVAESEFKGQQARRGIDANLKLATDLRKQYQFPQADAALAQALKLADGAPERRAQVEQARRDLAFVVKLDDIRFRKWVYVAEGGGKGYFNTKIASPEYRAAFAEFGLDLTTLEPADAAAQIAASAVSDEVVAAVDDWALYEPNAALVGRLLEVARRADSGPWTDRLRDPKVRADKAAVKALAAEADVTRLAPAAVSVLAELMERRGLDPAPLLTAARTAYPSEFELAFALGQWRMKDREPGRQIGPYEAARALRPDNTAVLINLGNALQASGDADGAVAAYRRAVELAPGDAAAQYNLGTALSDRGNLSGAIAAYRRAIESDPKYAKAYYNLGLALRANGDLSGAIGAYRRAAELNPKDAKTQTNLGVALRDSGDLSGAITTYRRAVELDPKDAIAHYNLGLALRAAGDPSGAIAAYRRAIDINPQNAKAHNNLGFALRATGDPDGAMRAFRRATEVDPGYAEAHTNLGVMYAGQRKHADCIACARAAIAADPKYANAHALLGTALQDTGDLAGARVALTEAARLDKRHAGLLAALPPSLPVAPAPREVPSPAPRP